jgi:hypothetical protein
VESYGDTGSRRVNHNVIAYIDTDVMRFAGSDGTEEYEVARLSI